MSNVRSFGGKRDHKNATMEDVMRNALSHLIEEREAGRPTRYGVVVMFIDTPDQAPENIGDIHMIRSTGAMNHEITGLMEAAKTLI